MPILAPPKVTGRYALDTDAFDKQIGCALLEAQPDGLTKPVVFLSRSLNNAEQAYDITYKKRLAVMWAVILLRLYLEESQVTIRTESDASRWTLNMTDVTGKLAQW